MQNKVISVDKLIAQVPDSASIMLGGFGSSGTPFTLIDELLNQGQRDLTIIKNDANETNVGVYKLVESGQVKKLIATHIGLNPLVMALAESGELDVELLPQGIFAERIRAHGAGLKGFVSDIGLGTDYEIGKEKIKLNDKNYLFEPAIRADFAFIHAETADTFGNIQFNTAGINFAPAMALAADRTFLEAKQLVSIGEISPSQVHLSGVVIDQVIHITHLSHDYDPIKR